MAIVFISPCLWLSHIDQTPVTHPKIFALIWMSLNCYKPLFIQSLSATTQPVHGEHVRNAAAFEWRAWSPAPCEVMLRGGGPLRTTRALLDSLDLFSVTPTRQCHLSPPSPLCFRTGRLVLRQTPPSLRFFAACWGATEISITASCPETRLLGGGQKGLSQEYYRTASGPDKPPVTASRDRTRPSPLSTWGWGLSLSVAERAL